MPQITWKKEYAVGIPSIDRQHREILTIFNAFLQEANQERYRRAYDDLGRIIDEHFKHEEGLMRKHALPHLAEHRAAHERIRAAYAADAQVELSEAVVGAIRGRLYRWIVDHVLNDELDRGIALALKKKGIYQA